MNEMKSLVNYIFTIQSRLNFLKITDLQINILISIDFINERKVNQNKPSSLHSIVITISSKIDESKPNLL